MQCDFFPVSIQKLFAISRFPVGIVDWVGLGVIEDVRFQHSNFRHPYFGGFDGISRFMIVGSDGGHALLHFLDTADFLLL